MIESDASLSTATSRSGWELGDDGDDNASEKNPLLHCVAGTDEQQEEAQIKQSNPKRRKAEAPLHSGQEGKRVLKGIPGKSAEAKITFKDDVVGTGSMIVESSAAAVMWFECLVYSTGETLVSWSPTRKNDPVRHPGRFYSSADTAIRPHASCLAHKLSHRVSPFH